MKLFVYSHSKELYTIISSRRSRAYDLQHNVLVHSIKICSVKSNKSCVYIWYKNIYLGVPSGAPPSLVFFGRVCAARDSKLAARSKKNVP